MRMRGFDTMCAMHIPSLGSLGVLSLLGALVACSPSGPDPVTAPRASASAVADTGGRIYSGNCVACHQESGRGIPGVYPSLSGSAVVLGDPVALARWIVVGQRPPTLPAGRYSTVMPHFTWMKAEDAAALASYLRSSFGNAAPAVKAETLRGALGDS